MLPRAQDVRLEVHGGVGGPSWQQQPYLELPVADPAGFVQFTLIKVGFIGCIGFIGFILELVERLGWDGRGLLATAAEGWTGVGVGWDQVGSGGRAAVQQAWVCGARPAGFGARRREPR